MPGWSLWLAPPLDSTLNAILDKQISDEIPQLLPQLVKVPMFLPHLTLTSNITPTALIESTPQNWLDSLDLSIVGDVNVRFQAIVSEDFFFKRLFIRCEKDDGLVSLAKKLRALAVSEQDGGGNKAGEWAKQQYDPHCSLAYSDKTVAPEMISKVEQHLSSKLSVGGEMKEVGRPNGWKGGRILLVPTELGIEDWKPVAVREI